ncbi:putative cyclase-domain-containing protein [Mycena capillaripes]|nr:putative cyclase-domain-containing protein [Mycena capillaripes]
MSTTQNTPVDWNSATIPTYDELPPFRNFPGCAWGVWGVEDQLGTVNLLTDTLVKQSAAEEIRTGKTVSLNWPLNFPDKPMFGRIPPEINLIQKQKEGLNYSRDDEIHINTQSGTQWDGLRHFPILEHEMFYNNTPASTLPRGLHPTPDPHNIDPAQTRIGMQNWADHGICGRGVLLDLVNFLSKDGVLAYDPWTTHPITVKELEACAEAQGVKFRRGDILILRVGFIKKYYESTQEARDALRGKPETFAGIEQSEEMKRFLWNNHFAAIASDQPALESWPPSVGTPHMHQTILGLWGMPIGEFFDLEKLSKVCAEYQRHTFFVSSWPLNIIGGAASPPNAAAFF